MPTTTQYEIKLIGRGGQGVVVSSELLAFCAMKNGYQAQSIPSFGPERRGALSTASVRISMEPVILHCSVFEPNMVIIFDKKMVNHVNLAVLPEQSIVVINDEIVGQDLKALAEDKKLNLYTINAYAIAMQIYKTSIYSAIMFGASARALDFSFEKVSETVKEYFDDEKNLNGCERGFHELKNVGY